MEEYYRHVYELLKSLGSERFQVLFCSDKALVPIAKTRDDHTDRTSGYADNIKY